MFQIIRKGTPLRGAFFCMVKFFFYPLMILMHTAMDMICGLYLNGTLQISQVALEVIVAVFGTVVFWGAHMIYKYDQTRFIIE